MLFRVTHIDPTGHRHKAWVSAPNAWHALDQMDKVFGAARAAVCVRLATAPVLHLVGRGNGGKTARGVSCAY